MNTTSQEQIFQRFKKYKFLQTMILVVFEIAYFLVIILHPTLRASMYTNPNLFALSMLLWFLLLVCFFFVYHDLKNMEKAMKDNRALSRLAHLDELTEMPNRYSCDQLLKGYDRSEELKNLGVCMLEISNIQEVNEKKGRETGDLMVYDFARLLSAVAGRYGFICRNGGNEYLGVFSNCDRAMMDRFLDELRREFEEYNEKTEKPHIVYGVATFLNCEEHVDTFSAMAKGAHDRLHGEGI